MIPFSCEWKRNVRGIPEWKGVSAARSTCTSFGNPGTLISHFRGSNINDLPRGVEGRHGCSARKCGWAACSERNFAWELAAGGTLGSAERIAALRPSPSKVIADRQKNIKEENYDLRRFPCGSNSCSAKVDQIEKGKWISINYLLLLGIALRVPAKLKNRHDDGHRQPAQQDDKHTAC